MQKVITSPEGTHKELYMPIQFTIQAETTYTCCTVRQRISDQLGPERLPSQCRTINADDKTAEKELTCPCNS